MKIFLYLRSNYRQRHLDVAKYLPKEIEVVTPSLLNSKTENLKKRFISFIFPFNPFLINIKNFNHIDNKEVDIVYTFGAFLKNTKVPYLINVDNPI